MSTVIAPRDTYVVNRRFPMPYGNDTIDAWAVTSSNGLILISFYAIMMKAIVTQFWTGIVLFGVGIYLGRYPDGEADSADTKTTIGLWNVKHSPQQVLYFMSRRLYAVKRLRDAWYPFVWFAVAAAALAAALTVPILKTKDLKIGTVAPVNPESVFVPITSSIYQPTHESAQIYTLMIPAALRAVGAAGTVPANTLYTFTSNTPSNNGTVVQVDYRYGISGSDFGLQKTPDLWLNVSGSCVTEYSWYRGETPNGAADGYWLWNDPSGQGNIVLAYSSSDEGPAFMTSYIGDNITNTNTTYALVISSRQRQSISQSSDPWYFTVPNTDPTNNKTWPWLVNIGIPPLSCWENSVWSYQGQSSDSTQLSKITNNRLSVPIVAALSQNLYGPMPYIMAFRLGRSNLASSTTVVGGGFDAQQCSAASDLARLINASYIATRNILSDSTLMSHEGRKGLTNGYRGTNGSLAPGSGDFVISSPDIITLSVRVLIIVPTVFMGIFILLFMLAFLPEPWRSTKQLNATRIHALRRRSTNPNAIRASTTHAREKDELDEGGKNADEDGGNITTEATAV